MTPSELLRRPPLGENVTITRDGDSVDGLLVGLAVRPDKIDTTRVGGPRSYLPGRTTITVTLAPWWAEIDLAPGDEIRVYEVSG